jgi:hypothetical protein
MPVEAARSRREAEAETNDVTVMSGSLQRVVLFIGTNATCYTGQIPCHADARLGAASGRALVHGAPPAGLSQNVSRVSGLLQH